MIVLDGKANASLAPESGGRRRDRMKPRYAATEIAHHLVGQPTLVGEAVELVRLSETSHEDNVIDRITGASECQRSSPAPVDRQHVEIEAGGEEPVQGELGPAGAFAQFARRVVDRGEADRAFELVGAIAHQEDDRIMGDDLFNWRCQSAIAGRLRQKADYIPLLA